MSGIFNALTRNSDASEPKSLGCYVALRCLASSISIIILLACTSGDERLYVSAATLSTSAFDLRITANGANGKFLYSYLVPNPHGPQVRSLTFDAQIRDSILMLHDSEGRECRSLQIKSIRTDRLIVNFGPRSRDLR